MTHRTSAEFIAYANEVEDDLLEQPVRLRDIRARMVELEAFEGIHLLKRSIVGRIAETVRHYYPLPEYIALYRRRQDIYHEHVRKGDFDSTHYKNVRISGVYGLCTWWLDPQYRYPYGDVRLLRPILGDVLTEIADWPRVPYPDEAAQLGEWYEQLSPGGPLYPSDDHLAYVERFEAFAEDIVWDSRDRDYITIVNFPAPPNALPPTEWYCTQHVLGAARR